MKLSYSLLAITFVIAGPALAQEGDNQSGVPESGALTLRTVVQKVVEVTEPTGESRTELVPVETAVPGDEVVYTVTFTNIGSEPADNVLITNPIPAEIRYEAGTAFGPGSAIEYSADGGHSYADPQSVLVSDENGDQRLASADEYTHIRWQLMSSLEPGAQGFARFRGVVR